LRPRALAPAGPAVLPDAAEMAHRRSTISAQPDSTYRSQSRMCRQAPRCASTERSPLPRGAAASPPTARPRTSVRTGPRSKAGSPCISLLTSNVSSIL
jgi:hypothetical protein